MAKKLKYNQICLNLYYSSGFMTFDEYVEQCTLLEDIARVHNIRISVR